MDLSGDLKMEINLFNQPSYFNTTGVTGERLVEYQEITKGQDMLILGVFQEWPEVEFCAFDIEAILDRRRHKVLLTSIRRSINTLCKSGLILETGNKKAGNYGRPNLTWKLKK